MLLCLTALLSLALSAMAVGQVSDGLNCVSLRDSTACPAFASYYVGLPGLGNRFAYLYNITTLEQFDQALFSYANSTSDYLAPLGCFDSYGPTAPYARYSLTRLCAGLIQDQYDSLPCNFYNNLSPPPLCESTCNDWIDSIADITSRVKSCGDSQLRNNTLEEYRGQCASWPGYNGTDAQQCITGAANEPTNCGFEYNVMDACRFCKTSGSDESCCRRIACPSKLSAGAIAGIVIATLACAVLTALVAFCVYSRQRRAANHTADQFKVGKSPAFGDAKTRAWTKHAMQGTDPNSDLAIPTADAWRPMGPPALPHMEEFFVVVHPYPPQMKDELALNIGDIVCLAMPFDDGWALGFNVSTDLKGAFPLVCIAPAPAELLEQLLSEDNFSHSGEPLVNYAALASQHQLCQQRQPSLALRVQRIRENVRQSLSAGTFNRTRASKTQQMLTEHTTIPQRTASKRTSNSYNAEPDSAYMSLDVSPMPHALIRPQSKQLVQSPTYDTTPHAVYKKGSTSNSKFSFL